MCKSIFVNHVLRTNCFMLEFRAQSAAIVVLWSILKIVFLILFNQLYYLNYDFCEWWKKLFACLFTFTLFTFTVKYKFAYLVFNINHTRVYEKERRNNSSFFMTIKRFKNWRAMWCLGIYQLHILDFYVYLNSFKSLYQCFVYVAVIHVCP